MLLPLGEPVLLPLGEPVLLPLGEPVIERHNKSLH